MVRFPACCSGDADVAAIAIRGEAGAPLVSMPV
jgi:hypothetical protein